MTSKMGMALRHIGGGAVFVMLREAEVGYTMVRDPSNPQEVVGPAVGEQKIVFEATGYREIERDSDCWEFTMMMQVETPAGPVSQRNTLFVEGRDILFVRVPSQLTA